MNLTSTNYTFSERQNILYRANEDTFKTLIPTISFYSAVSIVGVVGNILSIYIFITQMLKHQQNELFILLSVFNLLACGVCLPLDIVDMRNMYMYPSAVLCKAARFLNMFTTISSTLILCALAIFRLRAATSGAVISPNRTTRFAGIAVLMLLSASIAWIAAVVFGIRSSPTYFEDITGRDCSVADDTRNTAWPAVFNLILGIGFASLLTVTTTAYYRIWRIVKKSRMTVTAYTVTLNVAPGNSDEKKKELSHYEVKDAAKKSSAGYNKNKQEIVSSNTLILDDDCSDISLGNDTLTGVRIKDRLTPKMDNIEENADNIAKIHTNDGSAFANRRKVNSTSTFLSNASSVWCDTVTDEDVNPRLDQNSKRDNHYAEISDLNFTGDIWRMAGNPNSRHVLHNKTFTANSKPQTTYIGNHNSHHNTATNSTTKDVVSTTTSTHITPPDKPGKVKHELKRKLSKTSLEAAVTRTAFLLTLTFVVSYLPFFFVSIPRAIDKDIDYSQDGVKLNLVNTAIRLYFIMPAVSPAIFWASNLDFRRKCKAVCSKNPSFAM